MILVLGICDHITLFMLDILTDVVTAVGLVTQLPEAFYSFMLELQGKLAKMIKSVGKIDHTLYPFN